MHSYSSAFLKPEFLTKTRIYQSYTSIADNNACNPTHGCWELSSTRCLVRVLSTTSVNLQETVRRVRRAASETTSTQPEARNRPALATTPQARERAPALGRAALSIPHFLYAYFSLVLVYPNLLSLTTISPLPSLSSRPLSPVRIPSLCLVSTRLVCL
jgi:hypothetical protein